MANESKRSKVIIRGSDFSNNGRHGIAVGKNANVDFEITDSTARDSSEETEGERERRWFERPFGIVLLAVIAMGIAYYLGFT